MRLVGAIVCGVLLLASVLLLLMPAKEASNALAFASLGLGLVFGLRAAWDALRSGKFDIDVLMVLGAVAAGALGHPGEGALLLVLFTASGALEDLAGERTQREVSALHALVPREAHRVDASGVVTPVRPEDLAAGDTIRIRPGDRIPVDCTLLTGSTSVDQAALTGESLPRGVRAGDELFAGTVNLDDAIDARVLRAASESSLQRILDLVADAQERRAPVQRLLDRLDQPYSIGVLVLSIAVFLVWWLALGRPAFARGEGASASALYTAITVLIVASPCALLIATPTASLAGLARAAKGGVLVKGGQAMERLAGIGAMCLDKTGTITKGRPALVGVRVLAGDESSLLALAAAMESDSTHPIAQAILTAARERGITPAQLTSLNHVTAEGLECVTPEGSRARLGRLRFVESILPAQEIDRLRGLLDQERNEGHIAVALALAHPDGTTHAAVFALADEVRAGAATLTRDLHALGIRPVRMLTGDNAQTARKVATSLELDAFDADLLPEDKLRLLREQRAALEREGRSGVALAGDGINDAPALAAADASLAMGTIGTAAALENADAVLLREDLSGVSWVISLARRVRATTRVNLAIALGAIVIMLVLTLLFSVLGHPIPLSVGVVTHEGGTVLVVLNSLRLLGFPLSRVSEPSATHGDGAA